MKPSFATNLMPNQSNFPGEFEDTSLCLCHITKKEARAWDTLQGGYEFGSGEGEEPLQIRIYKRIGHNLKQDKFRDIYLSAIIESESPPNQLSPEYEQDYLMGKQMMEGTEWVPAPDDDHPLVLELTSKGIGKTSDKDSLMGYLPMNFVYILGIERGDVSINPKTDLPQFGGFGKFIERTVRGVFRSNPVREATRIGLTVAGAVLGGPVGAMAGSGAASIITGRKPTDAFNQALKAGALTGVAGMGAGMLGYPNAIGNMGNLTNMMGLSQGASGAAPASVSANGLPVVKNMGITSWTGPGAPANFSPSTTPSSFNVSNFLNPSQDGKKSSFGIDKLPDLASTFLTPLARQREYDLNKKEEEDRYRLMKDREEEELIKSGFYKPLREPRMKRVLNPKFSSNPNEPAFLYVPIEENKFKKGGSVGSLIPKGNGEYVAEVEDEKPTYGELNLKDNILIKGSGKGQDDLVHTEVPQGTYIIPADVMSMLGDGSSEAGKDVIKKDIQERTNHIDHKTLSHIIEGTQKNQRVPVALSNEEGVIWPSNVAILGDGHHETGIKRLDNLKKNIRIHKTQSGTKLPPKAKPISYYMKD